MKKSTIVILISLIFFLLTSFHAQNNKVKMVDFHFLDELLTKDNDTTYVINFWATWCLPCIKELPDFEKINTTYKDSAVQVWLISLDNPKRFESLLIPYVKNKNIKSNVALLNESDQNKFISMIDESWSGAIPATIFIKKDKKHFYESTLSFEKIKDIIQTLNTQ